MREPIFTCQICGRQIKAKSGLIAHHGYQQPYRRQGDGWRTSSCYGARRLPYEQAHDALDEYLVLVARWIGGNEKSLDAMIREPLSSYTYQRKDAWGKPIGEPKVFDRPDDFDPEKAKAHSSFVTSYVSMWRLRYHEIESDLRSLKRNQIELTENREKWKSPV